MAKINLTKDGTGQNLYRRAKNRIPGGTQLLTKRPEMFLPEFWPSYYTKALGVAVWDLDGNKYLDMSYNGIGACILGHADPDVNLAVHQAVDAGSMSTLNCPEEVELAELFCQLHPWAQMVRYARSGGEAMAIAVRIARAKTGRDRVAFCGYHGWHDWYLAANLASDQALEGHLLPGLEPKGVPQALSGTVMPFYYNQLEELKQIIMRHPGEIAAIVMEPLRSEKPSPQFLENIRQLADDIGAVLIFDEITVGFRLNTGGVHLELGVLPDIAIFAKAISNGYPMSVILGRESVMQSAQNTFISSTSWTERIGPTAALATLRKFQELDVAEHLIQIGTRVQEGWQAIADGLQLRIKISGIPPLSHFEFDYPDGLTMRTAFTQLMLERGFLATSSFYVTYAHQTEHVEIYLQAIKEVFTIIKNAVLKNMVASLLKGSVAHAGFRRLA